MIGVVSKRQVATRPRRADGGLLRFLVAAVAAAGVTFGLFLLMYELVSSGTENRADYEIFSGIHFGPVEIPDEVITRNRRESEEPPPPSDPPPPPRMPVSKTEEPLRKFSGIDLPALDIPLTGGEGLFIGNLRKQDLDAEGEIIPVVVIRPIYPREAALSGTEGWVKVEFTITETGIVKDPSVIEAEPPRVFNREAIRAILKWKFKPRVVDGIAVERRAHQVIEFTLDRP